ncbi:MAG: transcription elongation factor GreA [Actinomycetota bacterium]|nr:transcription elongation factor GreA [Actinomycetota bacterium]
MDDMKPPRLHDQEPSATLTRDAYDRLRKELDRLKGEGRRHMSERLLHARELGDIRENAEYDSAKNEQGLMESRIRELETILRDPDLVEGPVGEADEAGPGMLVRVLSKEEDEAEEEVYLLAASKEERTGGARTVSVSSPFGRALVGHRIGDEVAYQAPGGTFVYEIVGLEPHR